MDNKKHRILSYDFCKDVASKCKNATALMNFDQPVYNKSRKTGWLYDFYPKTTNLKKGRTLSYEYCRNYASRFNTAAELKKNDSAVYCKCWKKGWLHKFYPNMRKERVLDYKTCRKSAKRFKTRMEFREGDNSAYLKSIAMGWIDSFGLYSPGTLVYTDEEILATAKRYSSHRDFRTHHKKMYNAAAKRGLLEKCAWLEKAGTGKAGVPTNCVYAYEFKKTRTVYVGITTTKNLRHKDHLKKHDSVYQYAERIGVSVPKPKYIYSEITTEEASKLEQVIIEKYKEDGWNLINKKKGGSIGSLGADKWTKEKCIALTKSYKFVVDFDRDNHGVWEKMRKNGWDKECPWLERKAVPKNYWVNMSKEDVHKLAMQFKTRSKFEHSYRRLYVIAQEKGWIDEWFAPTNRGKNARPIVAFELDGVTVFGRYKSMIEATRAFGGKRGNINNACNGVTKTAYGKIFKYADEID